jgi:hypothetical protein
VDIVVRYCEPKVKRRKSRSARRRPTATSTAIAIIRDDD